MPTADRLLIRTDAGPTIGTGHVMRSLALAQQWRDAGGSAVLVHRDIPPIVAERFAQEGIECVETPSERGGSEDASHLASLAASLGAAVVLDGYAFGAPYQYQLHHEVRKLVVVDDHGQIGEYHTDFILDQNLGAAAAVYQHRPRGCHLLLGPRFALLRREFRQRDRGDPQVRHAAQRILVSFGGSDRGRETSKVLRALRSLDGLGLRVRVAIGAGDPNRQELDRIADGLHWIRLEHAVEDMAGLMAWADVAVTAGGSVCWELAFMGVPALLIAIADNQEPIARRLDQHGVAINLGRSDQVDTSDVSTALRSIVSDRDRRRAMNRRGRALVDGHGAERVVRALVR